MNPNRQPAGIPNGGQFAPSSHPESDVALDRDQSAAQAWEDAARAVSDALRALEDMTPPAVMSTLREHYPHAAGLTFEVEGSDEPGCLTTSVTGVTSGGRTITWEDGGGADFEAMTADVEPILLILAERTGDYLGEYRLDESGIEALD